VRIRDPGWKKIRIWDPGKHHGSETLATTKNKIVSAIPLEKKGSAVATAIKRLWWAEVPAIKKVASGVAIVLQ
jgi:hypothetical protein